MPCWPELSVKETYHLAIEQIPEVREYLPDPHGKEQRLPEKDFFWKVLYALNPAMVEDYIK